MNELDQKDNPVMQFKNGTTVYESDLENLPEFDWDNPKNKQWIEEEKEKSRKYYEKHFNGWSEKDLHDFVNYKLKLSKNKPELHWQKIHQIALKIFKAKIKNRKDH
ncbi:MAG: hypothetical protein A2Z91_06155 [Deltaproteobacteria bacterium GWA2_38_16]|nr:MAG: hypothetical protein A2Z91_06155 [Deltaproteobacteria bacterium GWA2_38_16]OGQ03717.1 MAG: hypothetical protein A3D19_02630 [Deltaproteobacteria bacterium RIFCSPHIGHO2_02_FULL_38_15]